MNAYVSQKKAVISLACDRHASKKTGRLCIIVRNRIYS